MQNGAIFGPPCMLRILVLQRQLS